MFAYCVHQYTSYIVESNYPTHQTLKGYFVEHHVKFYLLYVRLCLQ